MKSPFLILALAASLHAQQPKIAWVELGADAAIRGLDVYSTHRMLENGYRELILPKAIADHTPVMAVYSAGVVAGDYFLMRRLEKHHPKIALWIPAIDAAQDAPWAIHNLFLNARPRIPIPHGGLPR